MNIEITSVNIAYNKGVVSGVNVNFYATQSDNINLNGYIPLTFEEYAPIGSDIGVLKDVVKDKVITAINGEAE